MSNFYVDIAPIYDAITRQALVLTPNHRANVQLLEAFGRSWQQHNQCKICPTGNIYPIDIWARRIHEEYFNLGKAPFSNVMVMDPVQENLVWKSIIRQSSLGSELLNLEATSRNIQDAYTLLQQWNIPKSALQKYSHFMTQADSAYEDAEIFRQWTRDFEKFQHAHGYLSLSQLIAVCVDAIQNGQIDVPDVVIQVGFDQPPPLYRNLLDALAQKAGTFTNFRFNSFTPGIHKHSAANFSEELLGAARWAKSLTPNKESAQNIKIGVICPQLARNFSEIERVFLNVFHPESALRTIPETATDFTISGGPALDKFPMPGTALSILRLNQDQRLTLELCAVLRSAHIKHAEMEADARAALEYKLRRKGEQFTRLSDLRHLCLQEGQEYYCPVLGKNLQDFDTLMRREHQPRLCREWVQVIEKQLALFGWPGDRKLCDSERQQLHSWYEVLADFQLYTASLGKVDLAQALTTLTQLAANKRSYNFNEEARVQILGPVEASGLRFSHLWFLGLSEQNWPPAALSNPFIPYALQKEYGIPAACPDKQLQAARDLIAGLIRNTASEVRLSYVTDSEETQTGPSAVFSSIPGETLPLGSEHGSLLPSQMRLLEHMAVDILQEPLLLKHQANEGIQGGTSLIADQADCPFRSFAKHRLHARELPRVGFGLSPAILGTIVHNALEYFWRELRDQQALLDASDEALELLISTVVSAAIARAARQYPTTMTPHFSKLEQGRLEKLLYNWLEEERKRGSFKILALEYPLQWQHSHLTLNFKVDRIEELEDKSCGLVDYKSSAHKPSVRWDDQRQDKPQLLLYQSAIDASSEFAEVTSILYAQVNIENTAYIGISQDGSSYPGTEPSCQRQLSQSLSWDELKKQWQLSLQSLADEFLSGYLAISPKSNSSCQYCHLAPLCRINEVLEP